jgi:hypothetical protein
MTAAHLSQHIDIRTFGSIEEIRALDNFVENDPLSKANYRRLRGDYHLPEEFGCCVQKDNGKLCGEPHKHGWVAELQDGTATIIGGDCAREKFGADSSLVADSHRYLNEKRRRERLATMIQLQPLKTERIARLGQLRISLMEVNKRIKNVTDALGPLVQRQLRDMVKTRRSEVMIDATRRRQYVDDDGKNREEKSTFTHVVGSLSGVDLTVSGAYSAIYDAINDIVRAYRRAEELEQDPDVVRKSKEVESVAGRLQQFDRVMQDGERLVDLERVFLANDFRLLCFLSRDDAERIMAAEVAMRLTDKGRRKDDPRGWLSAYENAIKHELQVDSISVR